MLYGSEVPVHLRVLHGIPNRRRVYPAVFTIIVVEGTFLGLIMIEFISMLQQLYLSLWLYSSKKTQQILELA